METSRHFERSPGGDPEVNARWLKTNHCNVRVVDVRETNELVGPLGRLPFAEHVPLKELAFTAGAWDPHAPVILICRSGRRSARAVRTLEDLGFTSVASLTGGMILWNDLYPHNVTRAASQPQPQNSQAAAQKGTQTVSQGSLIEHFTDATHVYWTKVASLLSQGTASCVDGRDSRPVVGTPGGDAGELLLALATLEQVRDASVTTDELNSILDAYLDAFGRFYIHTDTHALHQLANDLRQRAEFVPRLPESDPAAIEKLVRHPPKALEVELLRRLVEPAHVGCGHLKLALAHPDEYGTRLELTQALLQAVHSRLWRGDAIDFVVLKGDHQEQAVVNVELSKAVHAFTRVPMITPRIGEHELFVNHPAVIAWLRTQNAALLFELDPWFQEHSDGQEAFLHTQAQLGVQQLAATVKHLAAQLPVYEARFAKSGVQVTLQSDQANATAISRQAKPHE